MDGGFRRGNSPFRAPLNQARRFIPLRLDDAHNHRQAPVENVHCNPVELAP